MNTKTIKALDSLLYGVLVAILALSFLMFAFVFIINWEDWFFGTKLAGPFAGVWLFSKAAVAFALTFLLVQYQRYRTTVTVAAVAYFCFLFLDASVTIRQNTAGQQPFSAFYAIFLVIPIFLLILTRVDGISGTLQDADQGDTSGKLVAGPEGKGERTTIHPLPLLLCGVVLLMTGYIIVIPFGIGMAIGHIPFLHQLAAPPPFDTLIVRVDNDGKTEWTTMIPGYSLGVIELVDAHDGSCIIYGTYWIQQQGEALLRVVKLDRTGNVTWDMQRSRQFGTSPQDIAEIAWVEPEGAGAAVWLTNGGSLQVDGQGAVIVETAASDTLSQPSTGRRMPARYYTSGLPATTASIRIWSEEGQGLLFSVEDPVSHYVLQSIYSVNPTADGGYLVSASINS